MRSNRIVSALALAVIAAGACGGDDSHDVRGRGLAVAAVPADVRARIYEAALRAAFDVSDPSLSLLLDPRELPRTVGLAPGGRLDAATVHSLTQGSVIKGRCEPALGAHGTAHCKAELPGYVVRFSPIFVLGPDSTELYVYAQKYDTPASGLSQTLRFERAYQVVSRGSNVRAVLEGRVPKEVRGESR
ncbi:MAG: hypothetical protein ACHQWU_06495 [Gemmatimonadales bacterium]